MYLLKILLGKYIEINYKVVITQYSVMIRYSYGKKLFSQLFTFNSNIHMCMLCTYTCICMLTVVKIYNANVTTAKLFIIEFLNNYIIHFLISVIMSNLPKSQVL